jgi:hypothetical protein
LVKSVAGKVIPPLAPPFEGGGFFDGELV